jgi:hypothetical protein
MGGEGSAWWRLNQGEGKMGTAGPAQAHGKGRGVGWREGRRGLAGAST